MEVLFTHHVALVDRQKTGATGMPYHPLPTLPLLLSAPVATISWIAIGSHRWKIRFTPFQPGGLSLALRLPFQAYHIVQFVNTPARSSITILLKQTSNKHNANAQ